MHFWRVCKSFHPSVASLTLAPLPRAASRDKKCDLCSVFFPQMKIWREINKQIKYTTLESKLGKFQSRGNLQTEEMLLDLGNSTS